MEMGRGKSAFLEGGAGERGSVFDLLVHGLPHLHRFLVEDALLHGRAGLHVVGYGLEHLHRVVDDVARDIPEGFHQETWIWMLLARPEPTLRTGDG